MMLGRVYYKDEVLRGHLLIWPKLIHGFQDLDGLKQSRHFHYLTPFEKRVSFWSGSLEKSVKVGDDWLIFMVPHIFFFFFFQKNIIP